MSETSRIHIRDVLPSLCQEQKRVFRQLETVKKKIVNAHYAVVFNQTCITENLLPYFTNVRLYDRAVQRSDLTLNFRKKLVEEEITRKKQDLRSLYVDYSKAYDEFAEFDLATDLRADALAALKNLELVHTETVRTRVQRKLVKLYGGNVVVPENKGCFVNLSDYELNDDEKELLNLGLNCHYLPRLSRQRKKAEIELLYQQICQLARTGKVEVNPDIQEQLQAESTRLRGSQRSSLISPRLRRAQRVSETTQTLLSDVRIRLRCLSS